VTNPLRRTRILLALLAAPTVLGACRGTPADIDGVTRQLASAGHKVEGFQPADAAHLGARRCQAGRIDSLDALVCEYTDEPSARSAHPRAEAWVGSAVTGIAVERGKLLLAISDRAHTDHDGRNITRIARTFRGK
jgi:hypothetical protein